MFAMFDSHFFNWSHLIAHTGHDLFGNVVPGFRRTPPLRRLRCPGDTDGKGMAAELQVTSFWKSQLKKSCGFMLLQRIFFARNHGVYMCLPWIRCRISTSADSPDIIQPTDNQLRGLHSRWQCGGNHRVDTTQRLLAFPLNHDLQI